MNQNRLLLGGLFIYFGAICFFLLEDVFVVYGQSLKTFGVILLIVGGIVTIIGILTKEPTHETMKPPKDRNCLKCGKAIPFEASICPNCKYDFNQIKIDYPKDLP